MHYGVYVPTSGDYDVRTVSELAASAERAGWDGFFIWDNLLATFDGSGILADTTVTLAGIALATRRLRFGPLVTPVARRRPWKLAKEMVTLDQLSGGRLILGVGLGGEWDFQLVGEGEMSAARARVMDETLEVISLLWSGEEVGHRGDHFTLLSPRMRPCPVQLPRIPVWTGGYWPGGGPFRRAARWDGVAPLRAGHWFQELTPSELHECVTYIQRFRSESGPFDVVQFRTSPGATIDLVREYEAAGATWWLEAAVPMNESLAAFRARVEAGPPAGRDLAPVNTAKNSRKIP